MSSKVKAVLAGVGIVLLIVVVLFGGAFYDLVISPGAQKAATERSQEQLLREQVEQLKRIADALEERMDE